VREVSIHTGYRNKLGYVECLKSIFQMHNETVNIWSHLVGFVYFAFLLLSNLFNKFPHNRSNADVIAVGIQLISYQTCMLMSCLFHTFLCHSEHAKLGWQEADHAGILLALWGTYTRIIVTNFSCFPVWLMSHLSVICSIFFLVFLTRFRNRSKRAKKGGVQLYLFLALALYAVAPMAHWISISPNLVEHNVTSQKLVWLLIPYGLGGLGLFFYTSRLPESWVHAGKCDLWGSSHQIWHMLIFAGMVSWYELTCWLSETRPHTCQYVEGYSANTTLNNSVYAALTL